MPRYIDADELVRMPWVLPNRMTRKTALECFRNIVNEAPTVDAVEVVRCKDCIDYSPESAITIAYCTAHGAQKAEDDFCSWGKRRKEK